MEVYSYNPKTHEYMGTEEAYKDEVASIRLGRDKYAMPLYTTTLKPPVVPQGSVAILEKDTWVVKKDFRGQIVYNLSTLKGEIWSEIGDLPAGFSTVLPERVDDVKANYLTQLKVIFAEFLSETISIPNVKLCFSYNSIKRLKEEQELGILFSRDDNNKIYSLTSEQYNDIINYLTIYGQYAYLLKWEMESKLKDCNDIEILKQLKKDMKFKISSKMIKKIVNMTEDERKAYFSQMVNNIK